MADKTSDDRASGPKTSTGVAKGEHEPTEPQNPPSADEPVSGGEHDPGAVEEAAERMLLRKPVDRPS
jgi:hypothetical protein